MITNWIRRCQECGNEQVDNPMEYGKEMTNSYRNRKCKRCKSESLDYGSFQSTPENEEERRMLEEEY